MRKEGFLQLVVGGYPKLTIKRHTKCDLKLTEERCGQDDHEKNGSADTTTPRLHLTDEKGAKYFLSKAKADSRDGE